MFLVWHKRSTCFLQQKRRRRKIGQGKKSVLFSPGIQSSTWTQFRAPVAPDRTTDWSKFSFQMIHSRIDHKWPQRNFISYFTTRFMRHFKTDVLPTRLAVCFQPPPPPRVIVCFFFNPGRDDVPQGVCKYSDSWSELIQITFHFNFGFQTAEMLRWKFCCVFNVLFSQ